MTAGYVVGLTDGEGCFEINFMKCSKRRIKLGWQVRLEFRLVNCTKEGFKVLNSMRNFFGFGIVYSHERKGIGHLPLRVFCVIRFSDVKKIRAFFCQNPPRVKKTQFEVWSQAVDIFEKFTRGTDIHRKKEQFLQLAKLREDLFRDDPSKRRHRKYSFRFIKDSVSSIGL